MKKSMKDYKRKKSYTKKRRNGLKGGVYSRIGTIDARNGNKIMEDNFVNMSKTQNNLAYFHFTNLENAFAYPNNDPNFSYHSLFISYIDDNINDLDVIKWSINNFLNDLLTKLNDTNDTTNTNKIVYTIKDLKINDFKFEFNLDKKAIFLSGNVYITNIKNLNNQIDNTLSNKLNIDATNYIKDFI